MSATHSQIPSSEKDAVLGEDVERSSSEPGATAAPMPTSGRLAATPFWRDVWSVCAQSWLVGWGVWGSLVAFLQSVWWHFLDSKTLGISMYGIGMLFGLTTLVGAGAFCMNLCIERLRPCLRFFVYHHWIWQGAVPAAALALALYPDKDVRTAATAVAAASAVAGQVAAMAGPADSRLSQRVPASMTIGLLMLQALRIGWSSATPTVDAGFAEYRLYGCVLGVAAAVSLFLEGAATTTLDGTPSTPHSTLNARNDGLCQAPATTGAGRLCWVWMLVGPVQAGAATLTLAFFSNAGAMPKYVGWAPFPGCLVVLGGMILGWGLCAFLCSAERGDSATALLSIVTALGLLLGSVLLFTVHSIAGAAVLSIVFPSLWTVVWFESVHMARQFAIGRSLFFAGFLMFVHVFCFVGVLTWGNTPVLGIIFGGRSDLWAYMVVVPMAVSIVLLHFLWSDDPSRKSKFVVSLPSFCGGKPRQLLPGMPSCGCGDAVNSAFVLVLALMVAPAVMYRLLNHAFVDAPEVIDNEIVVMAYNNENGFDTAGRFNGPCFVEAVREHRADYVTVAEGDAMHFNTGNRDALDYVRCTPPVLI